MSNNTRIMFLRNEQYSPCGCLAIRLDRRNHRVSYQYSVLNPKDTFDRQMARHLAIGRLIEKPITIPISRATEINMHVISFEVMAHLAKSDAPKRAKNAANMWLNTQEYNVDLKLEDDGE